MHPFLAGLAFLGFVLSLTVHITALLGMDLSTTIPFVWSLHVGVFVVFIPFVFSSRKVLGAKSGLTKIREFFPVWVLALGTVIVAYAFVNFMLFFLASQGGSPAIHDGKFVLQDHGRLIRELTAGEYAAFKANELRGFSGHWLPFYFLPFAYFAFCGKSASPDNRKAGDRSGPPSPN